MHQRFVETSGECQHSVVDDMVDQCQERLVGCVNADGNNFHTFSDTHAEIQVSIQRKNSFQSNPHMGETQYNFDQEKE